MSGQGSAWRRHTGPLALAAAMLAGAVGLAVGDSPSPGATPGAWQHQGSDSVWGTVQDEWGQPIHGAWVVMGTARAASDRQGRFGLTRTKPALATVTARNHLPRTLVLEPGRPRAITLAAHADTTLSLRFGGDVMLGRRFYERGPDGPALLQPKATARDHASLLDDVKPLLEDADLTVANLETPLMADPYYDPAKPRPPRFHPTKDLAFGTALTAAQGLADSGIDAVSLGNNHAFDGLGPGIASTIKALDAAGVRHFGAGRNEAEAWRPAFVTARHQRVAFIGCTTVSGVAHPIPYVAGPNRAGAALCDSTRVATEVAKAAKSAETVVLLIHGDIEYRREQTPLVRQLALAAHAAGAGVVVGSHPHVIGGLVGGSSSFFAETTGNLIFDQELWSTFPSYLVRVDVRGGRPIAASADPLVIDGYRPAPAIGAFADAVSRIAAGTVPGLARLGGPGTEIAYGGWHPARSATGMLASGQPRRLAPGWWVDPASAPRVRLGRDLLFGTGSMEPMSLGVHGGPGRLWSLGRYGRVSRDAACYTAGEAAEAAGAAGAARSDGTGASGFGVLLARSPLSRKDVTAEQAHRTEVRPGRMVTLLGQVRRASPGSSLQVKWYSGAEGASRRTTTLHLPTGVWNARTCRSVRLDIQVPKGAHYAEVFVRLDPPRGGQELRRLAVDNIRFVEWATTTTSGRRFDTVESPNGSRVTVVADSLAVGDEPFLP